MFFLKDLSIKGKMMAIIMLTSCLALLAAGAAFVAYELFTYRETMIRQLSTLADITGQNCAPALSLSADPDEAEKILAALSKDGQIVSAALYRNGKLWANYPAQLADKLFPDAPEEESSRFQNNHLHLFRPIRDPEGKVVGIIYLKANLDVMHARIRQYVVIGVAVLLL